jgi:hypothetical protein
VLEIGTSVADVPHQDDDLGSLAREVLECHAGGARDAAMQVDIGEAGEACAGERSREPGDRQVVVRDLNGRGLDPKCVPQRGSAHGARGGGEEATAAKQRHVCKTN